MCHTFGINVYCLICAFVMLSSNTCIWDRFREKRPSAYYIICYKNALRYNFQTVNAIDFLFSTLHSTPFLYVDLYFRVLHKLRTDVMRLVARNNFASPRQQVYTGELKEEHFSLRKTIVPN